MKHVLLLLSAMLLFSCQKEKTTPAQTKSTATADSLTATLQEFYDRGHFNGLSVSIADANGVLYSKGFGYADGSTKKPYTAQTAQPLGSVSKTFIGIAMLKAQELGLLNLDDDVNRYLPFKLENPNAKGGTITLRHIATHTSGINDTDAYTQHSYILFANEKSAYNGGEVMNTPSAELPVAQYLKECLTPGGKYYLPDVWGNYKPGERYTYSNFGAATAALTIEKASGMPYDAFVEKYVLQPLKMNRTHFNNKPEVAKEISILYNDTVTAIAPYHLITYADGGLASTADDMGNYLSELIKGYNGKGTLLKPESYKDYFKPVLTDKNFAEAPDAENPFSDEYNSGLFIAHTPAGYVGHTGGDPGVASMMFFDPKTGRGYFLMVNTGINNKAGMKVFYGIYEALVKNAVKLP